MITTRHAAYYTSAPAGVAYTDEPSLAFKIVPVILGTATFGDEPSLSVRFSVKVSQDFTDTGNVFFVVSPTMLSLLGTISAPNVDLKFLPISAVRSNFISQPNANIVFRADVTNGLLFSEVLQAVWNEFAFVLLDPELLVAVWTGENVLTDSMFGFPGIRNRIQTVRSKVTVQ